MEMISLLVEAPVDTGSLDGLDEAIFKLERIEELRDSLSGGNNRPISLGLTLEGLGPLNTAEAKIEKITEALRAVGESQWSSKLTSSALTSEAALEGIASEARAANAALAEGIQTLSVYEAKFGAMNSGDLARARRLVDEQKQEVARLRESAAMANRAEGAAIGGRAAGDTLGLGGSTRIASKIELTEATEGLTMADRAGALAALDSGQALERQREVAAAKINVMENLTQVTRGLTAADERLAGAAANAAAEERLAAQAEAERARGRLGLGPVATGRGTERGNGLINEKTAVDDQGRTSRMQKYQMGPGQTLTTTERGSLTETDYVQKYRLDFQKLDAEFASRRGAVAAQGALPGSGQQIAVLDAEVAARRELVSAMQAEGLGEDELALKQTVKANLTETQARVAEIRLANSAKVTDAQRAETEALRENLALMDRAVIMERGLASGEEARIGILRRQAAAYGELAESIREAGASVPGNAPLLRGAESKEARLNNEAAQLEAGRSRQRFEAEEQSAKLLDEYQTSGLTDKRRTTRQGPAGSETILTGERAANGLKESVTLTQKLSQEGDVLATTLTRVESSAAAAGRGVASANRSLFSNVATITAWAAGAAVLYGSLKLVKEGFGGLLEAQDSTASLENVFHGAAGGARAMRDELLELAAANGRAADEAIKTGIAYERMGLSQHDVLAATDLALKQANISESTAVEVTTALTPVMHSYGLSVAQTKTFLDELNATSAHANVANQDLLLAVSRVAPVANQAGLSLSELNGIAAVLSETTGQTGASVGTMIRSLVLGLENPTLQKTLEKGFDFKVKTDSGGLKETSDLLSELFVKYNSLSKEDEGGLISKLGGKKQGAALIALMDDYVRSQVLAIQSTRELGATEEENYRRRETARSQLQTIATEWQRLFINIGNAGGSFGITAQLTEFLKLIGNVLHIAAGLAPVVAGIIALMAVMAVRLVKSAWAMGENVTSGGLLMETVRALRNAWYDLGAAIERTNSQMTIGNRLMGQKKVSAAGAAAGVEETALLQGGEGTLKKAGPGLGGVVGLIVGTAFSSEMLIAIAGIAALEAATWGFNKAMEASKSASDEAADKLAKLNSELEVTNALMDGAEKAERLAGSLSKALPKLYERDPQRAKSALRDFSSVAFTEEEDPGGGRRASLTTELRTLAEQGRMKEAQTRLDQIQTGMHREKINLAERSERQQALALDQQQQSLALLNREITDKKALGQDTIDQEKRRKEIMDSMSKSRSELQRSFSTLLDDDEGNGSRTGRSDENYKKSLEARQKGIDSVYDALPTSGSESEVGKMDRELEKMDARKAMLEAQSKAEADAATAAKAGAVERLKAAADEFDGYAAIRSARAALDDQAERAKVAQQGAGFAASSGLDVYSFGEPVPTTRATTQKDLDRDALDARGDLDAFDRINAPGLKDADKSKDKLNAAENAFEQQQKLSSAKQEEIDKNEKTLAQERESLQLQRDKYAALKDALTEGERQGKRETAAFEVGDSQTERMLMEAGAIGGRRRPLLTDDAGVSAQFNPINRSDFRAKTEDGGRDYMRDRLIKEANEENPLSGLLADPAKRYREAKAAGNGEDQNRAAGEILQLSNRLTEIQLSLEERRYRIQADITNERRKENEEASKSLVMAGREDQLRAALLAKYEQKNGGFSSAQFQFLDQGTKEAVKKFTPDALPPEANNRSAALERERLLLEGNLGRLGAAVKETTDFINKNVKVTTVPLAPGAGGMPAAPQITPPPVNFYFAEQFNGVAQILLQNVNVRLDREFAAMRATLAGARNPVNAAQTPGVDASTGN